MTIDKKERRHAIMPENKTTALTEGQKQKALQTIEAALYAWECSIKGQIKDVKTAEYLIQQGIERFEDAEFKNPKVTCWWQITDYKIFDALMAYSDLSLRIYDHNGILNVAKEAAMSLRAPEIRG
jgi:hypothetical protein